MTMPDIDRRPTHVVPLALTTWLLALPSLGFAGWAVLETNRYIDSHDDAGLAGIGYLVAIMVAVPAVLGALLAAGGWLSQRRFPAAARALTITGLVITGLGAAIVAKLAIGAT